MTHRASLEVLVWKNKKLLYPYVQKKSKQMKIARAMYRRNNASLMYELEDAPRTAAARNEKFV